MELKEYWNIVKRWWWLMVACVLVASVSSYIGTLGMPRVYQATTTVMVGQTLQQSNPNSSDLWISQQLAQTYAEMVKRQPILKAAATALGLEYVPSGGNVSTRQVPGTQLLEISVRDTIPERAQAIADEIAHQLILQSPTESEDAERQAFVRERLAGLEENIQRTEEEIAEEQAKLEAANSARAIQQYQANISGLEQKLSSYESTYASLLLSAQGGTNYISIVEPASLPISPISPNVRETVMLAAAIGLALAVGGAVLIEFIDDTVKSPEEASRMTGLPVLGTISRIEGEGYADKLIVDLHPLSTVAEAYRVLRTNVRFSFVDREMEMLLVTSPGPTEGKSVTVANLATVMAQSGLRVVVVDTDLRRPVQHKIFGVSNAEGLSNAVLDPEQGAERYLQSTEVEGLWVLPSGPLPPNPAELLGSERMAEVVAELRTFADLLLFDSPPALVVTDAAVLAGRLESGVLLVTDVARTRRGMAKRAVEELERVHADMLGVVVNRMTQHEGGYYYQYYYREGEGRRRRRTLLERLLPEALLGGNGNGNGQRQIVADEEPVSTERLD